MPALRGCEGPFLLQVGHAQDITHPWFAPIWVSPGRDLYTHQQQQLLLILVVASAGQAEVAFAVDVGDADEGDVMVEVIEDRIITLIYVPS